MVLTCWIKVDFWEFCIYTKEGLMLNFKGPSLERVQRVQLHPSIQINTQLHPLIFWENVVEWAHNALEYESFQIKMILENVNNHLKTWNFL